jgi:hypothetical protein
LWIQQQTDADRLSELAMTVCDDYVTSRQFRHDGDENGNLLCESRVRSIIIEETLFGLSARDAMALTGSIIAKMNKAMRALEAKT